MSEDKRQISIYKINTSDEIFNNSTDKLSTLFTAIKANSKYYYEDCSVGENNFTNYITKALLVTSYMPNKWAPFLNEILTTQIDLPKIRTHSIILGLEHKTSHNIYVIPFGPLGYHLISNYIEDNFGIDVLSHLQKPQDLSCKTTKSQSLVGAKRGETSVYRDFHTLEEMLDDFGKIFQELMVSLDETVLSHFGILFNENAKKRIKHCLVKDSFKINSAIQAKDIESVLDGCEWADTQPKFPLNAVKALNRKHDQALIDKLNCQCYNSLLKLFNKEPNAYKCDLCHKEYDQYFMSHHFQITGEVNLQGEEILIRMEDLFDKLKEVKPNWHPTAKELGSIIEHSKLSTFDEEGKRLTSDFIKKHLFDEQPINEQKFFLLNGTWYRLEKSFLEDLDQKLKTSLPKYNNTDGSFLHDWKQAKDESSFIQTYADSNNTIVLHPHSVKNIELCDMMHWDDKDLYLYFIKQGFGNEIRSLASQVYISAKLIVNAQKNNSQYLSEVYKMLIDNNLTSLSEKAFLDLFTKNINLVFAFYDKTGGRILAKEPDRFHSNIAKYSTLNIIKDMKNFDSVSLKIAQIHA